MTILYHHRTLGDGAEGIHIAEMVSAFRALGHDVHVRGLGASPASASGSLAHRVKRHLPAAVFELAATTSNLVEYFDVRHTIRQLQPAFLYKRHARLDVGAIHAAKHAGVPVVLEINCLFTAEQYRRFEPMVLGRVAARLERTAIELADVVLAVSTPLAREIERIAGRRVVVLPNGADPHKFDPARGDGSSIRARYNLGPHVTVGWVGVMRDWHGLELLLDAVSMVDGVRLLLVGDGPARASIERIAALKGMADRLIFAGRVSQEEMPHYLAAMDVAVVASDGTGVASPMKLLEYMAMERAVVAPRLENIQDIVTDNRDGLLFTPGDVNDLSAVLRKLADAAPLRAALGSEARRTIERRRNWRANAECVLALAAPPIARAVHGV
jgi:glycosyltransferase involved in cell wall biosynthesis